MLSLTEFINEWDLLTARRLSGRPCPWSTDKVLRRYRFANFRRELDRTNRVLCSVLDAHFLVEKEFVFNIVAHRLVSRADFIIEAGWLESIDHFNGIYWNRKKRGAAVRPESFMSCKSQDSFLDQVVRAHLYSAEFGGAIFGKPTLAVAYSLFCRLVGKFTAWQASLDLLMLGHIRGEGFVHVGPGARFALQFLGYSAHKPEREIEWLLDDISNLIKIPLTIDQFEGALCEYGKYVKYHGEWPGKCRVYSPAADPLPPLPDRFSTESYLTGKFYENL